MSEEQEKFMDVINNLAGAVIAVTRSGSKDEKERLVNAIRDMNRELPDIESDMEVLKQFNFALISLVEGYPVSPDTLPMPYSAIYGEILAKAVATGDETAMTDEEKELREFLTKLTGAVILVKRGGDEKDKKELAEKLSGIHDGMPDDKKDAKSFVKALLDVMEDRPADESTLQGAYGRMYKKVIEEISSNSR